MATDNEILAALETYRPYHNWQRHSAGLRHYTQHPGIFAQELREWEAAAQRQAQADHAEASPDPHRPEAWPDYELLAATTPHPAHCECLKCHLRAGRYALGDRRVLVGLLKESQPLPNKVHDDALTDAEWLAQNNHVPEQRFDSPSDDWLDCLIATYRPALPEGVR